MNWIIGINAVMAMVTIVFGIVALARPTLLSGAPADAGSRYYAAMYAARAIPFGAGLVYVLIVAVQHAVPWLVVAGTIQVLDAAIGCRRRVVGAVVAPWRLHQCTWQPQCSCKWPIDMPVCQYSYHLCKVFSRAMGQPRHNLFGPVAQLVSAPPCHGGGRGFKSRQGRNIDTLHVFA